MGKELKNIKTINEFLNDKRINENLDLSEDYIQNLFHKYDKSYGNEGNCDIKTLKESLELIGDGNITERGDNHFMYEEMLKDNTLILVVHGRLGKSPYGGMDGYRYSIGVYKNDPRKHQIGGGYGASGIMSIEHTRLLSYSDYDTVHYNRNIISKVCSDVKKYSVENF